jgi:hypothetical protein
METSLNFLQMTHVIAGFIGLTAFWVPIFSRKGGKNHRLFGKIFKYSAYIVLTAAFLAIMTRMYGYLLSGTGPEQIPVTFAFVVFLGYLTIVTYIGLRHGLGVLQQKPDLARMNRPLDNILAWLSIAASLALIGYALYFSPPNKVLLYALSPIGLGIGSGILKAIQGKRLEKKAWFYEHMGAMIGTGIAFHTAFAVFGSARIFSLELEGWIAVIPWITPALLGLPAITIWTRYYKKKFGDQPA